MSAGNGHAAADAITGTLNAESLKAGVSVTVGLDSILVTFPLGFWAEPSHNLLTADGARVWQTRLQSLLQVIGGGLMKQLTDKGILREDGSLRAPATILTYDPPS